MVYAAAFSLAVRPFVKEIRYIQSKKCRRCSYSATRIIIFLPLTLYLLTGSFATACVENFRAAQIKRDKNYIFLKKSFRICRIFWIRPDRSAKNVAEYEPLRHFYTVCIKWECAGNGKTFKYCFKSKEDPLYQKVH